MTTLILIIGIIFAVNIRFATVPLGSRVKHILGTLFLLLGFKNAIGQAVWAVRHDELSVFRVVLAIVGLFVFITSAQLAVGNNRGRLMLIKTLPLLYITQLLWYLLLGKPHDFFATVVMALLFAGGFVLFYRYYSKSTTIDIFFSDWPPQKSVSVQPIK